MDSIVTVTFDNGNRELGPKLFPGERSGSHPQAVGPCYNIFKLHGV